jgi:hypothetical protein
MEVDPSSSRSDLRAGIALLMLALFATSHLSDHFTPPQGYRPRRGAVPIALYRSAQAGAAMTIAAWTTTTSLDSQSLTEEVVFVDAATIR